MTPLLGDLRREAEDLLHDPLVHPFNATQATARINALSDLLVELLRLLELQLPLP